MKLLLSDASANFRSEKFPASVQLTESRYDEVILDLTTQLTTNNGLKAIDFFKKRKNGYDRNLITWSQFRWNAHLNIPIDKEPNEISGIYVFAEVIDDKYVSPLYVGISRTIIRRLNQHCFSRHSNQASFAYHMLKEIEGDKVDSLYLQQHSDTTQKKIRGYRFALSTMDNHYDMYLLEVYLSMKWKTKWNTFKTH